MVLFQKFLLRTKHVYPIPVAFIATKFLAAKLLLLQACLKVWKSGGASSKGRGQKSRGAQ